MPNYVIMEYGSVARQGAWVTEKYTLNQDVQFELVTSTQNFRDFFPSLVTKILDFVKMAGQASGLGDYYLESSMALPMWEKTEPLRLNLELLFYTKKNPLTDVIIPIFDLCSLALPLRVGARYQLPFINVITAVKSMKELLQMEVKDTKDMAEEKPNLLMGDGNRNFVDEFGLAFLTGGGEIEYNRKSELAQRAKSKSLQQVRNVSLKIPGVIDLPIAFVTKATPIFSKELTKKDYPLWGQLNLEIRSIEPADANMLFNSVAALRGRVEQYRI